MPKGGTYHHPEPYVVHPDKHKTHSWAPVIVYSSEHGHYHLTYHPHQRPPQLAASLLLLP
jgi:hypothetical protein